MSRFLAKISALLLAPFLVSCASNLETQVTRFHQLPPPAGETIEVQALNPAYQNAVEFTQYADMIGARLGAVGYKPPVKGQPSVLVAHIDYGVGPGAGGIRQSENPVSVGVGVGGGSRGAGIGIGISSAFGSSSGGGAQYVRWLKLNIDRVSDGKRIFEGRAVSEGKTNDLSRIMPFLVDAMFKDFPGKSGESRTITVDAPE